MWEIMTQGPASEAFCFLPENDSCLNSILSVRHASPAMFLQWEEVGPGDIIEAWETNKSHLMWKQKCVSGKGI